MNAETAVLVVDDELAIRRLLRLSLETNDYRIYAAENGRDGLAKAAHFRPEVIILDMNLPDMEGVEVLRRLREWTATPVIVLSVRDVDELLYFAQIRQKLEADPARPRLILTEPGVRYRLAVDA